jgi:hypothetical protein
MAVFPTLEHAHAAAQSIRGMLIRTSLAHSTVICTIPPTEAPTFQFSHQLTAWCPQMPCYTAGAPVPLRPVDPNVGYAAAVQPVLLQVRPTGVLQPCLTLPEGLCSDADGGKGRFCAQDPVHWHGTCGRAPLDLTHMLPGRVLRHRTAPVTGTGMQAMRVVLRALTADCACACRCREPGVPAGQPV